MALEQVDYADGGVALKGWLARPQGVARGAIVIFPTIMNRNAPMDRRAQMLADAGYVALIADFYGEIPPDFAASQALSAALKADVDVYRARIAAGIAALRAHPAAAGLPLAAIGYCQGGQAVLEAARSGEDLALVASFHGLLNTDRKADRTITPRVLVCHGDADPLAPREDVLAFWAEMDAVAANWHFHSYSGVKHGFTDPGSDARGLAAIGYDASADRQSWAALMSLLDEVLG
ncbi:dienelactone hydrolase family protein [Novosphingobium percolationis]|uniref:dienelactone hydrolase family protein n=1 Tax=Novosphingobium percolationis TaxID=2871811 RepID=UPI001CD76FBE|nr:dienelactone hydrolase family protein [Novosphingobium percolationis]